MGRLLACALLVLCLGCSASRHARQPERPEVLRNADFILENNKAFFAKPDDKAAAGDTP